MNMGTFFAHYYSAMTNDVTVRDFLQSRTVSIYLFL